MGLLVGIGGTGGMGEIFPLALMRRHVWHGALTMRLGSHVRSAVKTASWRAFAAVDTFGLVWLFSGHDTTHAIAAAAAQLGRAATILGPSQNIPPVIQPNLATETIRV